MTDTNTQAADTTASAEPKLTGRAALLAKYNATVAKIADLTAKRDALASEINAIDALASVTVGTAVFILVGKKDERKEVQGVVQAEQDGEDGKLFRVTYGTGFDLNIVNVKAKDIALQPRPVAAATTEAAA